MVRRFEPVLGFIVDSGRLCVSVGLICWPAEDIMLEIAESLSAADLLDLVIHFVKELWSMIHDLDARGLDRLIFLRFENGVVVLGVLGVATIVCLSGASGPSAFVAVFHGC